MAKTNPIQDKTFLFTGTLTEFTREEAEALVTACGGKVLSGVSAKLNYLVVGKDAGSKLEKAKALGTVKILTEKEFLKMVPKIKNLSKKALVEAKTKLSSNSKVIGRAKKTVKGKETIQSVKVAKPKKAKDEVEKPKITRFKYSIDGYGSELAWMNLNEDQFKYWRGVYDKAEDDYDAKRELINHLRHDEGPEYRDEGYLGDYRNNFDDFNEYPFYEGSTLKVELFSGDEFIEVIEIPLNDERIKKTFYDGFVDKTINKKKYTKGTVFAKTEDRGGYCIGEYELQDEEAFSLKDFEISVETIQGFKYVSKLDYNDNFLDNEVYPDNYNKHFDAWIVWS